MLNKVKVIGLVLMVVVGVMMVGCKDTNSSEEQNETKSFFEDFKEGFEDAQE